MLISSGVVAVASAYQTIPKPVTGTFARLAAPQSDTFAATAGRSGVPVVTVTAVLAVLSPHTPPKLCAAQYVPPSVKGVVKGRAEPPLETSYHTIWSLGTLRSATVAP